jgi:hypothetical protein
MDFARVPLGQWEYAGNLEQSADRTANGSRKPGRDREGAVLAQG